MAKYCYRPVKGFDQTILTLADLLDNSDNSTHLQTAMTQQLIKRIYMGVKLLQGYDIHVINDVIESLQINDDVFLSSYIDDIKSYCYDYFGYAKDSRKTLFAYWVIDSAERYVRDRMRNALVNEIVFTKHQHRKDNEMCLFKNDDTGERLIVSTLSLDQHITGGSTVTATRLLNRNWRFDEQSNKPQLHPVIYSYDVVFED